MRRHGEFSLRPGKGESTPTRIPFPSPPSPAGASASGSWRALASAVPWAVSPPLPATALIGRVATHEPRAGAALNRVSARGTRLRKAPPALKLRAFVGPATGRAMPDQAAPVVADRGPTPLLSPIPPSSTWPVSFTILQHADATSPEFLRVPLRTTNPLQPRILVCIRTLVRSDPRTS